MHAAVYTTSLYNCILPGVSLASVLSTKPLQLLVGEEAEDEGGEKLPSVDHGPLKEGAVGKRGELKKK